MKIVNLIKRINLLNSASDRADLFVERNPSCTIDYCIDCKLDSARKDLNNWKKEFADRKIRISRRNQIKLACKILKIDYNIIKF